MRAEHRSRDALLHARWTGRVDASDVAFLHREAGRSTNDNRALMAAGALMLSDQIPLEEFELQPALRTMGFERSWLYGAWTLGTCAICWKESPAARARLRSSAEWARLTVAPVRSIRLLTPGAAQERRKSAAPKNLTASFGCRYLWNLELRPDRQPPEQKWIPELDVLPRLRARGWLRTTNPELRWAFDWLHRVQPRLLGEMWPLLPLVRNHRVELRRYADGSIVTASNRGTHLTRGPVSMGMIRRGVLTLATASEPREHGEWYQSQARIVGEFIEITGHAGKLRVELPGAPETQRIIWTDEGVA